MPGKLAALCHWEKPHTISELWSVMGFCNGYSGYVRLYVDLWGHLHKVLQVGKFNGGKGTKKELAWTTEAEKALVMDSNSSSAANERVAVAIALQPVNHMKH